MPTLKEAQRAIIAHFRAELSFAPSPAGDDRSDESKHIAFFLLRRTGELTSSGKNPSWLTDPALDLLKKRVALELAELKKYVAAKLGTLRAPGPLGQPTEPGSPAARDKSQEFESAENFHLDLKDVAFTRKTTADDQAALRTRFLTLQRRHMVRAIVWRAAAIHDTLWNPGDADPLRKSALDEVLDRRLRMIERMMLQIASPQYIDRQLIKGGSPHLDEDRPPIVATAPRSGWEDSFRVRPFEYPEVNLLVNRDLRAAIGEADIAPETAPTYSEQDPKPWHLEDANTLLVFNFPPAPGLRPWDRVRGDWSRHAKPPRDDADAKYDLNLQPVQGDTAADAIDFMMLGKFDWWNRSWLFCDHVISALELEALLFALRRLGKEADFNSLPATKPDFVTLASHLRLVNDPALMSGDPADVFFELLFVDMADLQVGDQLIFWNTPVYRLISPGSARFEYSLISDLRSSASISEKEGKPNKGIEQESIEFVGHGARALTHNAYEIDFRQSVETALRKVREKIDGVAHIELTSELPIEGTDLQTRIIYWAPFEQSEDPGSWWIVAPLKKMQLLLPTVANAKALFPSCIIENDVPQSAFRPYPNDRSTLQDLKPFVLFPVYQPVLPASAMKGQPPNRWQAYFNLRRNNPAVGAPILVNTTWKELPAGAMFTPGTDRKIKIIRPRVRS
jgi:hypothetical protein